MGGQMKEFQQSYGHSEEQQRRGSARETQEASFSEDKPRGGADQGGPYEYLEIRHEADHLFRIVGETWTGVESGVQRGQENAAGQMPGSGGPTREKRAACS